eukprot:COSAG01_NODE_3792_length_5691_cov_11.941166_7_plen_224_part_00
MASKASNGYSVFCRQDFIGIDCAHLSIWHRSHFLLSHIFLRAAPSWLIPNNYSRLSWCCVLCAADGMLDCKTHAPLPDYYAGILWSKLMGTGVLAVTSSTEPDAARSVRAYAHCTANRTAAVTVLLINLQPRTATNISLGQLGSSGTHRTEWHLTGPNGTDASVLALNGALLQYRVDPSSGEAVLPSLEGLDVARTAGQDDVVMMAPASIAFVQVDGVTTLCS